MTLPRLFRLAVFESTCLQSGGRRSTGCLWLACLGVCLSFAWQATFAGAEQLAVCTFQADVTPPLESPLCDGLVPPAKEIVDPLFARGIVLLGSGDPIVLCAVDWVGIGNAGHDAWRQALAEAAGTSASRVAVHCLHQHDAPGCDFDAEALLAARGLSGKLFHVEFAKRAIAATAEAVRQSLTAPRKVTHAGVGTGTVERVASNRRILGPDGKVQIVRYSASRIPEAVAAPEGVIDPLSRLVTFYEDDQAIVSLSYYATHPQSYYGQGGVSADFVGMARRLRDEAQPDVFHVHFNGAGGNVAAGKYNDGSPERRPELAQRLAAGMAAAWESTQKFPITAEQTQWKWVPCHLPPRTELLNEDRLLGILDNAQAAEIERLRAARDLAFLRRAQAGPAVQVSSLMLGSTYLLHLPGELFVEYQLLANELQKRGEVCVAAYGDYGPGYIGTQVSYSQGGYETSYVSRTAPEVEPILDMAIKAVLDVPEP